MPLYEYRCDACGNTFEKLRRMQDSDRDLHCPQCDSEAIERLLSAFSMSSGCGPGGSGGGRFT